MTILILCLSIALILAVGATPVHPDSADFDPDTESSDALDPQTPDKPEGQAPEEKTEIESKEPAVSGSSVEAALILEKILAENKKPMDALHRF